MSKQSAPVRKNEVINGTFEDLTHEGSGVAKVNGYPLFVPYGLPGEKAKIKVIHVKKNYGFGKIEEILEESEHRVDPPCPVYEQCGGCQLQHMSYERQLEMKLKQVKDSLRKLGGLPDVPVHPVKGMKDPWRYRNKVQMPVKAKDGEVQAGFYQKKSHRIIDMDTCIIQQETNDRLVDAVCRLAQKYNVSVYDEDSHQGVLRHIMVRTGQQTGDVMVVLITKTKKLPNAEKIVEEITEAFPNVKSIAHNINFKRTNVIMGDETHILWGEEYIKDSIGDISFAISPRSFYQVNPVQTKVLYDQALEYAELTGKEIVIDAYCGIGTISLFLAQQAKKVYGVEIVPEAVDDAKQNAKLNNIDNAEFFVGEAEKIMPWWRAQGLQPDVVVVDPPRKGCEEDLLNAMLKMKPQRIVYVSCNPSILARDLRILVDGGYDVKEVQPVDMFPQTNHVECVALIELK
ncbi:23S rRNA (uracil(1939)-C(5))-methyltransferase RlmD [Bacillaceae bacterium S4-13-56]